MPNTVEVEQPRTFPPSTYEAVRRRIEERLQSFRDQGVPSSTPGENFNIYAIRALGLPSFAANAAEQLALAERVARDFYNALINAISQQMPGVGNPSWDNLDQVEKACWIRAADLLTSAYQLKEFQPINQPAAKPKSTRIIE